MLPEVAKIYSLSSRLLHQQADIGIGQRSTFLFSHLVCSFFSFAEGVQCLHFFEKAQRKIATGCLMSLLVEE